MSDPKENRSEWRRMVDEEIEAERAAAAHVARLEAAEAERAAQAGTEHGE